MKSILLAALLLTALPLSAQEPSLPPRPASSHSVSAAIPPMPDLRGPALAWAAELLYVTPFRSTCPHLSTPSVTVLRPKDLPRSVTVFDDNILRLPRRFLLSNGQAWNHGPFPDSYLDARTLSMPLPR